MSKKHKNKKRLDADVETLAAQAAAAVASEAPTSETEPVVEQPVEKLEPPPTSIALPELGAPAATPDVETTEEVKREEKHVEKVDEPVVETTKDDQIVEEKPAEAKPEKVAPAKEADIFTPVPPPNNGVKLMAEEVFPSRSQMMINSGIPAKHTAVGDRLVKFLDEYDEMVKVPSNDKLECKRRVMKLYQALQIACPTAEMHQVTANDVTRIVFDRFMKNWGTLYTDGNIFRLDYSLPGGGAAVDKLNMYFTAILELVHAARDPKKKITFDNARLGTVLKNTSILNAITRMRDGITRRQDQLNGEI